MKIFLTGATGFLGKRVLKSLLKRGDIECVWVCSRKKKTHPHPRVRLINGDLSDPAFFAELLALPGFAPDAVIHLAGEYNFRSSYFENYRSNVLSTLNLLDAMKLLNARKPTTMIYASTYAVGYGLALVGEKPLTELPPKSMGYAFTKAIAEKAITDSTVPHLIFRFGVLVGDSDEGQIEKLDGPYPLLELLHKIASRSARRLLKVLPIPARGDAILPLVPVDYACQAILIGVERIRKSGQNPPRAIYGVYNPYSVRIDEFVGKAMKKILPGTQPLLLGKLKTKFSDALLGLQTHITQIPKETFQFGLNPVDLHNPGFLRDFPECRIPSFAAFEEAFFRGFYDMLCVHYQDVSAKIEPLFRESAPPAPSMTEDDHESR